MTTIKKLELRGKRWLERTNGKTYYSAVAIYNGQEIARIDFAYGYGDQWLYEICKAVKCNDFAMAEGNHPTVWLRSLERDHGVATFYSVSDVNRKKDLQL